MLWSTPLLFIRFRCSETKTTSVKDFRELINEIALLMGYEAPKRFGAYGYSG